MIRRTAATRRAPGARAVCLAVALAVALAVGASCSGDAGVETARVQLFAAASFAPVADRLAAGFEDAHPGVDVRVHLAGTPTLVLQLRQGASADVVVLADELSMDALVEDGLVSGRPEIVARNRLAIVVEPGNPKGISGLADLVRDDVVVALGGETVPVGRYAERAFRASGLEVPAATRESSVAGVIGKVALGEVDAGVVYVSDAVAADDLGAVALQELDVAARYPGAVLVEAREPDLARALLDHLASPAARRVLADAGFPSR